MCRFRPLETVEVLGVHAGQFQELRPCNNHSAENRALSIGASPGPEMAPESGSAFACASPHAPRPAQEFECDSQPGLNGSHDATSIRVPNIAPLIQEPFRGRGTKCNKTTKRKNLGLVRSLCPPQNT